MQHPKKKLNLFAKKISGRKFQKNFNSKRTTLAPIKKTESHELYLPS